MPAFDRHIARTVLLTGAIALLFLSGIDFLIQSAAEADDLGGQYRIPVMLASQFLQLPEKILLFMPAAVLIGGIIGLGQLASQNELTVMLAAGVSRLRIVRAAVITAFLLGALALVIGETIAPKWRTQSSLLRAQAKGESAEYQGRGLWLRDGDALVHIGALQADGSIERLRFYRKTDHGIEIASAERAHYQAPDWQLSDHRISRVSPETHTQHQGELIWRNGATPAVLQSLAHSKQAETLQELHTLTRFLAANGLAHQQESLKFWQRLFLPLSAVTMLLLALPFVFGRARDSHQGTRLIAGILCGVSYYIAQGILANLALLYHWPPLAGALAPIVIFAALPVLLLRNH